MTKNLEISELLDIYGKLLTNRQKQIAEDYYSYDLSLGEIAANCGITRQAARDALKSAEKSLQKYESLLNLQKLRQGIIAAGKQISDYERLEIIKELQQLI